VRSDSAALEAFFVGLALEFWRAAIPAEATAAEVAFCLEALDPAPGAEVLDVPCGHGRHALGIAAAGHPVVGVDLAAEEIAVAEAAAGERGLPARFVRADMRDLPWEEAFGGAVCLGNSFGYLDHRGNRDFLAAVSRALRPGARFVLDTSTAAESLLPRLRDEIRMEAGGVEMVARNDYDAPAGRLDIDFRFRRDGREEARRISQAVHTAAEVARLLGEAGLETIALHGGPDGSPYRVASPRLLIVAERPPLRPAEP